jgi:hypothetical protein
MSGIKTELENPFLTDEGFGSWLPPVGRHTWPSGRHAGEGEDLARVLQVPRP